MNLLARFPRSPRALLALPLMGAALISCDNSATSPLTSGIPAQVVVVGEDQRIAPLGETLPEALEVIVLDQDGDAISGVQVDWEIVSGGSEGSEVSPDVSITDADGLASTFFTMGSTLVATQVKAKVLLQDAIGPEAIFSITPSAGPAATLVILDTNSGDGQVAAPGAELPSPLHVQVQDQFGNAVAGENVTWEVIRGGGQLSSAQGNSDASGFVSTSFTLGSQGGFQSVRATHPASGSTADFEAFAGAVALQIVSGDGQMAPEGSELTAPLRVRVVQAGTSTALEGITVRWSVLSGGGSVSPVESRTDAQGIAETRRTLGAGRGENLTQASVGSESVEFSATAVGTDGAFRFEKVSGDSQFVATNQTSPRPMVVRLIDDNGTGIAGATVNWSIAPTSGGRVLSSTSETDDSGFASMQVEATGAAGNIITVLASTPGFNNPITFRHTVTAATSQARFMEKPLTGSGDGQVGAAGDTLPQPLVVRVLNANRAPVVGVAVQWEIRDRAHGALESDDPQLEISLTDAGGYARISRSIGSALGEQYTYASVPGLDGVELRFTTFNGSSNDAVDLFPTSTVPLKTIRGRQLSEPLSVTVVDSVRSPVAGTNVGWAVVAGSGKLLQAFSSTSDEGVATVDYIAGPEIGPNHRVRAYLPAIGQDVFFDIFVTGEPTTVAAISGAATQTLSADSATIGGGVLFANSIAVQVRDSQGNTVKGAVIEWVASESGFVSPMGREQAASLELETNYDGISRVYMGAQDFGAVTVTAWIQGTDIRVVFRGFARPS